MTLVKFRRELDERIDRGQLPTVARGHALLIGCGFRNLAGIAKKTSLVSDGVLPSLAAVTRFGAAGFADWLG